MRDIFALRAYARARGGAEYPFEREHGWTPPTHLLSAGTVEVGFPCAESPIPNGEHQPELQAKTAEGVCRYCKRPLATV